MGDFRFQGGFMEEVGHCNCIFRYEKQNFTAVLPLPNSPGPRMIISDVKEFGAPKAFVSKSEHNLLLSLQLFRTRDF